VIATLLTSQVVADGAINGLVYALIGIGVVLVHRSTRVINFAVASMGLPGAGLFALLVLEYGVPYWVGLPLALAAGVLFSTAAELLVVRRLFRAPRVILLVATIGLSQLALAITVALPGITDVQMRYPKPWAKPTSIGDVDLSGPKLTILVTVPLVAAALGWLLTRTTFGRKVTAAVDNPDLARVSGISPKRASTLVWAIAGLVSTLSLVLIAARIGNVAQVSTLGPATMTRGLIVAVLAGMASFPRAIAAGLVVGIAEAVVGFNSLTDPGRIDALLLAAVLIAVFLQTRRADAAAPARFSFAPRVKPIPAAIRDQWWVRQHGRIGFALVGVLAAVLPVVVTKPSQSYLATSIVCFGLAALSVSVVTGWSGQLSLGQMAFAGVGGLGTAALMRGVKATIYLPGDSDLVMRLDPLTLPAAVLAMTAATAGLAVLIGLGALRVRGLLLGVTTFVFAYAAQVWLFRQAILTGGEQPPVSLPRTEWAGMDLRNQRTYFWCVLTVAALTITVVARLRRRAPGRNMLAVRDNAATAAAYTISPTTTKLAGFALSGAIAGLAGGMLGALAQNINTNEMFVVADSLDVVSMAVIGGLGSISGPFLGAIWVQGLPALFPDNELVPLFASSIGMLLLLLYFPSGLVQLYYTPRDALFAWMAQRATPKPVTPRPASVVHNRAAREGGASTAPALVVSDIVVTFGGVRAVDRVSLQVQPGEVVGLIGTNGAGKSTLLNAIGGYVPSTGRVAAGALDLSSMRPHQRSRQGLGRTFQAATLFPELTVRETVMVALEARGRSGLFANAFALPQAGRRERRQAAAASDLIDFLGLGAYADSLTSHLSTGTRRIVELAGLLALDAKVLCLDEPTAGVAQRETERFGPLILAIRRELDASVLIIEHDMPLIMSISDRVYCLEAGAVIAEGTPAEVRNNPAVVASYLGTDERAIERSDVPRAPRPAVAVN
jgi:ABC-type branched-subunit amino acid transport system ATPase component/ABC-type branched-subunit amino acid transport system permease subunit